MAETWKQEKTGVKGIKTKEKEKVRRGEGYGQERTGEQDRGCKERLGKTRVGVESE